MDIENDINELEYIFKGIPDIEFDLKNIEKIKSNRTPRQRQDYMNKAAKKCRNKKKEIFILMDAHIKELHAMINNDNLKKYNNTINKYNENIYNIKKR